MGTIEFYILTYASFFVWVKILFVLAVAGCGFAIYRLRNEKNIYQIPFWIIGGIFIIFFLFSSSLAPRTALYVPPNRSLIEYQNNREEVVIETPGPRYQVLEGFVPLNQGSSNASD